VPACPIPITLTQPDGASFEAALWGDEWSSGVETAEGYTVLQDPITGYWEYARRAASGNLELTGLRPGLHDLAGEGIEVGLRPYRDTAAQGRYSLGVSAAATVQRMSRA
jgi:hypothetical protein